MRIRLKQARLKQTCYFLVVNEQPLFWSDEYCDLNGQFKVSSTHEFDGDLFDFDFIYAVSDQYVKSPGKATFGGIWISDGESSVSFFVELYKHISDRLKPLLVKTIVLPPLYFCPNVFDNQSKALETLGFTKQFNDVNFHIEIDNWSPALMSKGNRKKIRQFLEAGGEVVTGTESDYLSAYNVLKGNREQRGVNISMDSDTFISNLVDLPRFYRIYLAKIGQRIAGVAYVVKISDKVNYVLFWGDDIQFRNFSPVASILDYLVQECKLEGFTHLDLGISSVDGVLDYGLARFKQNLGAVETIKQTYGRSV